MSDVTDQLAANRRALSIGDLILVPVRRWMPVFLMAMLGLIAAALYLVLVPPVYTATSVVVVRAVVDNPFALPSSGADRTVNMNVENGIATGNEVVSAVSSATGVSAKAARDSLNVEVPVGAQILRFLYSDRDEGRAITGANTAATSYLAVRKGMYTAQRQSQIDSYNASIAATQKQAADAAKTLPRTSPSTGQQPPQVQAQLNAVQALNEQISQMQTQLAKTASIDVTPGFVTRTAVPPAQSSQGSSLLLLIAALLGGAIAGVVLAFVRESVDRRVRSASDAADALNLPALAEIRSKKGSDGADMRYAAMAVASRLTGPGPHRIVVLSARADEGRAAFYERLAATLEKEGHLVRRGVAPPTVGAAAKAVPLAVHVPDMPVVVPKPPAASPDDTQVIDTDSPTTANGHEPSLSYPLGDASAAETTLVLSLGHHLPERNGDGERRQPASVAVEMSPAVARNGTSQGPRADSTGDDTTRTRVPSTPMSSRRVDEEGYTLVNAAPAEADEQGVRDARGAHALVVVARDRTRVKEVKRLVERLRVNGVEPMGFVVVPRRS